MNAPLKQRVIFSRPVNRPFMRRRYDIHDSKGRDEHARRHARDPSRHSNPIDDTKRFVVTAIRAARSRE
jgi:hypothetical protein